VVECTALEMRHTGNRIGGSNPSLSATLRREHAESGGISNPRLIPLLAFVFDKARSEKNALTPRAL
jgi:hypothetical protein